MRFPSHISTQVDIPYPPVVKRGLEHETSMARPRGFPRFPTFDDTRGYNLPRFLKCCKLKSWLSSFDNNKSCYNNNHGSMAYFNGSMTNISWLFHWEKPLNH